MVTQLGSSPTRASGLKCPASKAFYNGVGSQTRQSEVYSSDFLFFQGSIQTVDGRTMASKHIDPLPLRVPRFAWSV
ncbi:hypothetical protein E2P81_ATG00470 [Venturia nashicola]|uniref:Uncharacterized protein n=1 Tax=Venturia nashicola TaxID=86259 RepID=A0A4Z1PFH1_9PEZI|nr:hypothetical protein E6O75_ATG00480 [Venturia nashicola]TLD39483.1 hypothetical protein E2P81_ATG00470 [Venturia nashicola]